MALSARVLKGRDYATRQKGGGSIRRRRLSPLGALAAYAWIGGVLLIVLSPHLGVLLLSLAQVWSFSPLPDAYTLAHYATVFQDSSGMTRNTLLYCGLPAGIDVLLGIVLAIGFLRLYKGITLPGTDTLLTSTWVMIMLAYAVRRLPYALRSCVAALQQVHVSLEEAAESLGATKLRTIRRVLVPLMAGDALRNVTPDGSRSCTTTFVALHGPLLLTVSV